MAGSVSMKMKRKDLDEVNDDFSDFSLSSPARKSRRLGISKYAGLPPILEEEETETSSSSEESNGESSIMEEFPHIPENDERAGVLFRPINTHSLNPPSDFSFSIGAEIISSFRSHSSSLRLSEVEVEDENPLREKENLAIIPQVPFQIERSEQPEAQEPEPMEADEVEAATTMDISMPQLQKQHNIA